MYPDSITVQITDSDIAEGVASNCEKCPIALAVQRLFPDHGVSAAVRIVVFNRETGETIVYLTPSHARDFMENIDLGKYTMPFTFTAKRIS